MKYPYIVEVTEQRTVRVIVDAENREDAADVAHALYNTGVIDMDNGQWITNVDVLFKATRGDMHIFPHYTKE